MSFLKNLSKTFSQIVVKPLIFKPLAKLYCTVAPFVSKAPVLTEEEAFRLLEAKSNNIGKSIANFSIGGTKLSKTGFGKFVKKVAKFVDDCVDAVADVIPVNTVNTLIDTGSQWIADKVVTPFMDSASNIIDSAWDKVVTKTTDIIVATWDKVVNAITVNAITDSNSNVTSIGIAEPTNKDTNVTLLTKGTTTKQVSTSDKQSLEKVSELVNNKNDSSVDCRKVTENTDSISLSNSNVGYNQYQAQQYVVKQQEQVSRSQELENQDFANKFSDQQPSSEEHVIEQHM